MTTYDTIVSMGAESIGCPPYELGMEFAVVVEGNGGTNDKSIWVGQISARVADATEILLSLTTVKNVMVSMNEDWEEALCSAHILICILRVPHL